MPTRKKTTRTKTARPNKKTPAGRATAKAKAPRKAAKAAKKVASKTNKAAAAKRPGARADFGAPIDGFFAKQTSQLRPVLDALRKLVGETAPAATASLKWGMPFYSLNGAMMCAISAHKAHVNLILAGPPGAFADPEGRLSGDGKTGRHLKLTSLAELPKDAVRRWLETAAQLAHKE